MKRIRYLSSEEVEWFHGRILELTGGEPGDLAKANLEFVLGRVKGLGEGLDFDKAIVKKAGFLPYNLVVHHPFVNGNKRTAFEVVETFLELNGYGLRAGRDEVYGLLADIGAGKESQARVEQWIPTNLAKRRRKG